jgi:gamma-glutamylcyclotransferase (GGCT)/AIG2-like uncharacterized protein YtfP
MGGYLFVYGTLHPERAPQAIADVARRLRPVGAGWIRARRYELGAYPGAVLDERARVDGEVFALPSDGDTLARLDAYEDYRADHPEGSLYLRVETTVMMHDGSQRQCWVYVYNQVLPQGA